MKNPADYMKNPPGHYDNAGRWFPADRCVHCDSIRSPSRAWPFTLRDHCRTYKHVAALFGVTIPQLKKLLLELKFDEAMSECIA